MRYPWIVPQLLATVSMVHSFDITPCTYPIQPKVEKMRLMRISQKLLPSTNLLQQFRQNPCLELEHYADAQNKSTMYTFYGTCDLQRMFRYTARFVPLYTCWTAEVAVWNPAQSARCESNRSEDSVTIYDELTHTRSTDSTSESYYGVDIGLQTLSLKSDPVLWIAAASERTRDDLDEIVGNVCNCERIKHRSLVQHWKAQCSERSADRQMAIVWSAAIVLVITAVWFTVNRTASTSSDTRGNEFLGPI